MEDDIVLALSSQHNYITVQNQRGSTTVVIISNSVGGNEYNSPNTSPDDSIEMNLL